MKDKGIPWICSIPEAWDIFITTENTEGNAGMKNINPNSVCSVNSVVKFSATPDAQSGMEPPKDNLPVTLSSYHEKFI